MHGRKVKNIKIRFKYVPQLVSIISIIITSIFFYNTLSNPLIIQIKSLNQLESINTNNKNFLYFGRPSCPSCKIFLPILEIISKDYNEEIFYFNSDYFRNETNVTDEQLLEIFDKYEVQSIPLISYIKNDITENAFGAVFNLNESNSIYNDLRDFVKHISKKSLSAHQKFLIMLFIISLMLTLYLKTNKDDINKATINNYLLSIAILMITSISIVLYRFLLLKNIHIQIDVISCMMLILILSNTLLQFYLTKLKCKNISK